MTSAYAARARELVTAPGRIVRRPLAPWTLLVLASTLLLLSAGAATGAWWAATYDTRSTSFSARLPSTLLRVDLDVARGDVEIVGGARDEVLVERTDSLAFGHEPEEGRFVADGVLRIESRCAALVVGSCRSDYRVTVPDNVPVTVAAERGDVEVSAFRGSAFLTTRGGDITVHGFCGLVLEASSSGGDIDVGASCSANQLALRTNTGDVAVDVPPGSYSVDADTRGGRVEITGISGIPNSPFVIQVLTNTGDVSVEAGS